MAEISQNNAQKGGSKVRARRLSTKIDMTPMVDLAFLLLTFFILTTTFKDVTMMDLQMPDNAPHEPQVINENKVLSVVLAGDSKVYWWTGPSPSAKLTNYSKDGIRKIFIERRQAVPDIMVLIKPMDEAKYENVVDVLDEITITGVSRYAIVDITADDKGMLPSPVAGL